MTTIRQVFEWPDQDQINAMAASLSRDFVARQLILHELDIREVPYEVTDNQIVLLSEDEKSSQRHCAIEVVEQEFRIDFFHPFSFKNLSIKLRMDCLINELITLMGQSAGGHSALHRVDDGSMPLSTDLCLV